MTMGVRLVTALVCCVAATGAPAASSSQQPEIKALIKVLEGKVKQQKDRLKVLESLQREDEEADPGVDADEARRLSEAHELSIYPDPQTGYLQSNDGSGANLSLYGALDHLWLIACGAMVMMMQAGFACVHAGVNRFKHVQNILLKNQINICISALSWYVFGYAFAYGDFSDGYFAMDFAKDYDGSGQVEPSRKFADWFFQWAFSAAAVSIVSGGVAERLNFPGYALFATLMTSLIYPIVVSWTWGKGWLHDGIHDDVNFYDFAGSGIVHLTGGIAALVGAAIVRPRVDRWVDLDLAQRFKGELPPVEPTIMVETDRALTDFEPHSLPLQVWGTFILWFGWYGLNCGSTFGASGITVAFQAALVAVNTTLSAAAAGIVAFFLQLAITKKYNIIVTCNGILAGLVSITAGCANVEPGSAIVIGLFGGAMYWAVAGAVRIAKIDDTVDAFAVHGACGLWGLLAAALFDMGKGFSAVHIGSSFTCVLDTDGESCLGSWGQLFSAQIVGILAISAFSALCSGVIFLVIRFIPGTLYDEDTQVTGTDQDKHSPNKAYAMNVLYDGTHAGQADTNRPPMTPEMSKKNSKESSKEQIEDNYPPRGRNVV